MNILKFTAVVLLSISALSSFGQDSTQKNLSEERARKNAVRLRTELSLSDEQTKRVEVLNLKFQAEFQNEMKTNSDKKEGVRIDGVTREEALKQILTPEQFSKFIKNKEERKARIQQQRNRE